MSKDRTRRELLISATYNKWMRLGLSTNPANRALAEKGVDTAYELAGLAAPKKLWYDSPTALTKDITTLVSTTDSVQHCVVVLRTELVKTRLAASSLSDSIQNRLDFINPLFWVPLRHRIWSLVWHRIWEHHHKLSYNFDDPAPYEFLGLVGEDISELRGVIQILEHSGGWFPFNKYAFLVDRPQRISLDSKERLHSSGGPAVEWRDGTFYHFKHGNVWRPSPLEQLAMVIPD